MLQNFRPPLIQGLIFNPATSNALQDRLDPALRYACEQEHGIYAEGIRTIRGSALASDRATAVVWAKKQRALLTGDANGGHFVNPERWETAYEIVPRVQDGLISGTGENVKVVRVSFTFSQILPKYPPPT